MVRDKRRHTFQVSGQLVNHGEGECAHTAGKVSQPIIRAIRQSAIRLLEPEQAVWDSKHPSLGVSSARSVVQRATPNRMLTRSGRAGAAVIINMASC